MIYLLEYTAKDGGEHEHEFEALSDKEALAHATQQVKGGEGLLSGITLYSGNGLDIWEFDYGSCEWTA